MFRSNILHYHFIYEVWMTMMENCGHWPSARAAPALCHAHCPLRPAAISAIKTTDRFGPIYVPLATLQPTHL